MKDDYGDLVQLLADAVLEDRKNLAKYLKSGDRDFPSQLVGRLHEQWSGLLGSRFPGKGYKQLVTDVADHIGIDWNSLRQGRDWPELSCPEIEDAIVLQAFKKMIEKLPEADRKKLAEELGKAANDPDFVNHILTGGAMAAGGLSGFHIYLLATTVLGGVTAALGITLPFVIYTTVTRGLGVALGPIGWALLGISVLFHLNRANWSRLLPAVVYISYIRNKPPEDNVPLLPSPPGGPPLLERGTHP